MEGTTTAQKASLGNCHLHPAFFVQPLSNIAPQIVHLKMCFSI